MDLNRTLQTVTDVAIAVGFKVREYPGSRSALWFVKANRSRACEPRANREAQKERAGHLRYCAPASSICSAIVRAKCSGERTRANGPKLSTQL